MGGWSPQEEREAQEGREAGWKERLDGRWSAWRAGGGGERRISPSLRIKKLRKEVEQMDWIAVKFILACLGVGAGIAGVVTLIKWLIYKWLSRHYEEEDALRIALGWPIRARSRRRRRYGR